MTDRFRVDGDLFYVGDRGYPMSEYTAADHDIGVDDYLMRMRRAELTFESGYLLSILWGNATYSSNYETLTTAFIEEPTEVEVGVLHADRTEGLIGSPLGYQTVEQVQATIDALNRGEVPVIVFEEW